VAVARQGADGQARILEALAKLVRACPVVEQRIDVQMIVPGPAAGSDLDRLDFAERLHFPEHLIERKAAEHRSEDAELHRETSARVSTFVHTPPRLWLSSIASTTAAAR